MFIMVTASTGGRFFNPLKITLNHLKNKILKSKLDVKIIVYDLGMNKKEYNEINNFNFITLENFDFSKYPDHVSIKKYNGINGTYAWKPIIIYEVCEKYGGIVHWFDNKNLYRNLSVFDIIKSNNIYSPRTSGTVEQWTHPKTLKYMNGFKYLKYIPRNGAVFGINYEIEWCKKFVKTWKDLSLIKECICPEGSDRTNHRQDQAVLTLLYYIYEEKYNFKSVNTLSGLKTHYW